MQKKFMAVAVAGALAAPGLAFAQTSTVNIYGVIVENVIAGYDRGGTSVRHDFLQSHDSELGFRGEEQLGGGLSAWFQCASTIDLGGGPTTSTFCGKNSGVGFKGGWGNAFIGMWDTPHKLMTAQFRPFSTSGIFGVGSQLWSGAGSNIANGVAGGNNTQTAASFTRRQRNLISYWSPNWGGFEAKAAFSQANEATAQVSATTASKPRLWSLAGTYTNGPFAVGAAYENHKNYNTAVQANYTGGNDHNWSLGGAYTFAGVFKFSGIYSRSHYALAAAQNMNVSGWALYGDWAIMGPHRLRLGYTKGRNTRGTAGTAAAPITVGNYLANGGAGQTGSVLYDIQYAYAFSKRTELNFGYARVNNDNQAMHALQTSGTGLVGQDQSAWQLGIKHTF